MIKIGDTLYRFDGNHRVYKERGQGPDYPSHFVPFKVVGETPRSWLLDTYGRQTKISKTELKEAGKNGYHGYQWYTAKTMEDDIWVQKNRARISSSVGVLRDVNKLKAIAELVGVEL